MKRGALTPAYRGTLRNADGSPIDLSSPQIDHVDFVMRQRRTLEPVVEAAVEVLQEGDAVTGTDVGLVQYAWVAGDTDLTGIYNAEFALYDANGNVIARVPSDGYQEIQVLGNLSEAPAPLPPPAEEVLSALPEQVDLRMYAGDDFSITVTVTEPDGTPAVLDGAILEAQIRSRANGPILGEFTATGTGDTLLLSLPGTVSATLPSVAVYDCEWVDRSLTLIAGTVYTEAQVTQ
jgi:hypothetical protein